MVTPAEVDGGVLEEVEIEQAVMGLKWGRLGVPSGMRAEYLKG